jgi:hypothetical protein
MLKFLDDTQIGVFGLDETLEELHSEGRPANDDTAEEIMKRLEDQKNYIPSSDSARKEYAYVLLKEYKKYVKDQAEKSQK